MVVAKEQRSGAWIGALNSEIIKLQERIARLNIVLNMIDGKGYVSDVCYRCQDEESILRYKDNRSNNCIKCFCIEKDNLTK